MGLFWDLMQQSQISEQRDRHEDMEGRVRQLETELRQTQRLLRDVIVRLENKLGTDLDSDGRAG